MFFTQFLPVFSIALTLIAIAGGYVAFRSSIGKQSSEIQDATINALKVRVETLESQLEADEKELTRLRQVLNTVRHALKRRGLHIEIEGEFVTLIDADGQARSTRLQANAPAPNSPMGKVQPIKLTPIDDNSEDVV